MTRSPSLESLQSIRAAAGQAWTRGLTDDVIEQFLARDPRLARAIETAVACRTAMSASYGEFFRLSEKDLSTTRSSRNPRGSAG